MLLYKVINWWYDCLPGESDGLCGQTVTCRNSGGTRIVYDGDQKELTLFPDTGFAEMISVFDPGCQNGNVLFLKCIRLNERILGKAGPAGLPCLLTAGGGLIIRNVEKDRASRFFRMQRNIGIEIRGRIAGLLNGRIALHPEGSFLKSCPKTGHGFGRSEAYPVTLLLYHVPTKEELAVYAHE